jgi:hypothetical protein
LLYDLTLNKFHILTHEIKYASIEKQIPTQETEHYGTVFVGKIKEASSIWGLAGANHLASLIARQ